MEFASHIVTVRRLKKYIDDVIGKKANLPDTSKTIIGNIAQINGRLTQEPYIVAITKPVQADRRQLITSYVIPEDGVYDILSEMAVSISSAEIYINVIYINADDSTTHYKSKQMIRNSMLNGGGSIAYMILSLKKGDSVKVFADTGATCDVTARLTVARRF